jgi:hypothetical protein
LIEANTCGMQRQFGTGFRKKRNIRNNQTEMRRKQTEIRSNQPEIRRDQTEIRNIRSLISANFDLILSNYFPEISIY